MKTPFAIAALCLSLLSGAWGQGVIKGSSAKISGTGAIKLGGGVSACGPPNYACTSRSTAAVGTLTAPITGASVYNTTWHDSLNPTSDCRTLLADVNVGGSTGVTATTLSQGNNTWSGGANDHMWSVNRTYVGIREGGTTVIFHLTYSTIGGTTCAQNISQGGENPGIDAGGGAFSFSAVSDNVYYIMTSNHILTQCTITSDTTTTCTTNANFPFDFDSPNCPGVTATGAGTSTTTLSVSLGDALFVLAIAWTGGQGYGHNILVYKPGSGCADMDVGTGNIYAYCSSGCGSATPIYTSTVCTSSNWSTGSGIHGTQITSNGDIVQTSGACFDQLGSSNLAYWQIGTNNILGMSDTGSTWDGNLSSSGHNTMGATHVWITYNPSPNARIVDPLSTVNLTAFSTLYTFPGSPFADSHGGHPLLDAFDAYPWILETSNSTPPASYTTPPAYFLEVYGLYDSAGTPIRFGPTWNSGLANQGTHFGCGASIPSISQDGQAVVYLTDVLQGLGNGTDGQPLCLPVVEMLQ